jgi:hypothetical protein
MLKTREANQKQFTASATTEGVIGAYENWRVVAVTAEKKVATVDTERTFNFCNHDSVGHTV